MALATTNNLNTRGLGPFLFGTKSVNISMDNFFQRDPRIDPESAIRDLEKKLHWCIQQLIDAGIATDRFGNNPNDFDSSDIFEDAQDVKQDL